MKIFLSWSGERSKAVAEALHDWLPKVIQSIQPWMSAVDIDRGARWSADIAGELENTRIGILCMTPENLEATWIHFEAGALSKTIAKTFVCPYLFQVEPTDLKGPLVQFNAAKAQKDDTKKLLLTINSGLDIPLEGSVVSESFEVWWPKLEERLNGIPAQQVKAKHERPQRELLEEILDLVRAQTRGGGLTISERRKIMNQFKPNAYVIHPAYGRGVVIGRWGSTGAGVQVNFEKHGQQTIDPTYLTLVEADEGEGSD